MTEDLKIVIIGASGYIGLTLYQQLSPNHQVTGTYCHSPVAEFEQFNLLTDDPASLPVDWSSIDSVILASGITRIEECARHIDRTRRLNVTAVKKFCDFAAHRDLHLVFLSTDFVYEGTPDPTGKPRLHCEDETLAPTTQHGIQRAEAERYIQAKSPNHLIARLTMNVSVTRRVGFPFASWVEPLMRGERLRLANDWIHCISCVNDTAKAIEIALQNKAVGVYNVAAPTFCSRYEWGLKTCAAIGADPSLITPCSIDDLGFRESRPRDLSLDTSKFRETFQFEFAPPEESLRTLSDIYRC